MELARLEDALKAAEAEHDSESGRELLLNRIVDHAIEHRRAANTFQFDPVLVRLLSDHAPFQSFVERLYGMLVGDDDGPDKLVRLAALTCVVGGTVAHPLVAGSTTTPCELRCWTWSGNSSVSPSRQSARQPPTPADAATASA